MKKLLAIDTSSSHANVGLLIGGELVSRVSQAPRQAAQKVLPMIAELLAATDTSLSHLDAIAVQAGPGSFTGLRIGIGITQGLSLANSTPVIALSSLAVTAMAAIREARVAQLLVSQIARGQEVYFGAYQQSDRTGVTLLGAEQLATPAQIELELSAVQKSANWLAVGGGWNCLEQIRTNLGVNIATSPIQPEIRIRDLCDLAVLRLALGEAVQAEQLKPNYIKEELDYSQSA